MDKVPDKTGYNSGETPTLTAYPDAGYEFIEWQGDLVSTNNPETITMDADKIVTAVFAPSATTPAYIIEVTSTAADLQLGFETVSGKIYTLYRNDATPNLTAGGWYDAGESPLTGDGSPKSFTVPKPASGTVFYTIEYEE